MTFVLHKIIDNTEISKVFDNQYVISTRFTNDDAMKIEMDFSLYYKDDETTVVELEMIKGDDLEFKKYLANVKKIIYEVSMTLEKEMEDLKLLEEEE